MLLHCRVLQEEEEKRTNCKSWYVWIVITLFDFIPYLNRNNCAPRSVPQCFHMTHWEEPSITKFIMRTVLHLFFRKLSPINPKIFPVWLLWSSVPYCQYNWSVNVSGISYRSLFHFGHTRSEIRLSSLEKMQLYGAPSSKSGPNWVFSVTSQRYSLSSCSILNFKAASLLTRTLRMFTDRTSGLRYPYSFWPLFQFSVFLHLWYLVLVFRLAIFFDVCIPAVSFWADINFKQEAWVGNNWQR